MLKFIETTAANHKAEIWFSGDIFHNHSILHVSVVNFWDKWFRRFNRNEMYVTCLLGNHDFGLVNKKNNALVVYSKYANIVDEPQFDEKTKILFMPYYGEANSDQFVEDANKYPANLIFMHDTVEGAQYENGFYAPNGIKQNKLNCPVLISGHIHTPGVYGKTTYVGSPRWQTVSDANIDRHLYLYSFTGDGIITDIQKIQITPDICTPIVLLDDSEENPLNIKDLQGKTTVNLYGSKQYIASKIEHYKELGIKVRTFPIAEAKVSIKESDGVETAFYKFMSEWQAPNGTPPAILRDLYDRHGN